MKQHTTHKDQLVNVMCNDELKYRTQKVSRKDVLLRMTNIQKKKKNFQIFPINSGCCVKIYNLNHILEINNASYIECNVFYLIFLSYLSTLLI